MLYTGGIVKENDAQPIKINGIEDHIQILVTMSKNIALAQLVEK
jgi:putative transposase